MTSERLLTKLQIISEQLLTNYLKSAESVRQGLERCRRQTNAMRLVEGESRSRAKPDFCHAKHSGAGQKAAHIKKEKIILLTEVL